MLFSTASILSFLALTSLTSASPLPNEPRGLAKRATNMRIKSYRDGTCLTGAGGKWGIGTAITTGLCSEAPTWTINNNGSGSIILEPSNTTPQLALDAGTGTDNNEGVKLWTSYPGLFQQTWYYTDDNRIAITGGDQCLDQGDDGPQTYQCTTGNTNQIWYLEANQNATDPLTGYPITAAA
ncbi:hypothetical protein L202_06892 [Cryptococcus amylolentus CBS 6039]|uniref:Ricin B lectin domain-containing protein n=1 Tax=Cryptococcus amylolentus CBS 6039 TaxID=1295533 RepID=A0A1E3HFI0_9TREE|nr:hypothetical protein L202_06892 [Cryptococcus amylolentus CBS 6039]ODN74516.1 hypothetical protein L202_06892 [Cryptococcus amylolentus CBS 6039]